MPLKSFGPHVGDHRAGEVQDETGRGGDAQRPPRDSDPQADPAGEVQQGLRSVFTLTHLAGVWAAGEIGRVTEDEVRQAMRDRLGITMEQVGMVMAEMWRQYLGVANTELIAYARSLRPAYRTGILSNSFVGACEREQRTYGPGDAVDELIYSHEVGLSKPEPALWEHTCRRMGVAAGEMVFLDNAPPLVESAGEAGIQALLFQSTAQAIADIDAMLDRAHID